MDDVRRQKEVTVSLMDVTAFGASLQIPYIDDAPSAGTRNSSEEPAGKTLVSRFNLCLTLVGFFLYILDMVSDIGASVYYASNGQWWRAMVTLAFVYGAVIIHTAVKWGLRNFYCADLADCLLYIVSLLINWPDVKQYGALCLLEWQMYKSPTSTAHVEPEWRQRKGNVAFLKFTEGVWEAYPQAILQLCLLVPDLYGAWTWTNYLRIAGASISLCTAGAALVNWERYRITINIDLPLSELVVLHVWAVPVTVCRLLPVALLLTVHPYWALAGVALHLVLRSVYWCSTLGDHRALDVVVVMCLDTLQFFISPFAVDGTTTSRRVLHAVHFMVNTAMIVVWSFGTPLVCAHPALYTAIICFNAAMFAVGVVGWQLHEYYWPGSYLI